MKEHGVITHPCPNLNHGLVTTTEGNARLDYGMDKYLQL